MRLLLHIPACNRPGSARDMACERINLPAVNALVDVDAFGAVERVSDRGLRWWEGVNVSRLESWVKAKGGFLSGRASAPPYS